MDNEKPPWSPLDEDENPSPWKMTWTELFVVLILIGGLTALLLPAVKAARETGKRPRRAVVDLKRIVLAMYHYEDQYGSLPPAYTVDAEGKPLHGWRVLLLPFLDADDLYRQIRLDEPWDSEHNSQFHATQHPVSYLFRTPKKEPYEGFSGRRVEWDDDDGRCDFSVVVGPDTLFPGSECRKLADIPAEEKGKMFLVVERRTPIRWMEPNREITEENSKKEINRFDDGLGSRRKGAWVAYADGVVLHLPEQSR